MTHAHITTSRGYLDGKLLIDGTPFPHPIRSITYRLDADTYAPMLTVEFEVDHLTVDHEAPADRRATLEWDRKLTDAFRAAETGAAYVADARHADSTIRLVVFPDKEATA